ncbi:putative ABC-type transporter, integral membrane subunit [uncultured spirochete]|jgi:thiamine transport system permease protein|uniref:Putative ABC-type transporter, integral membrane subunit n=1 Tax=uncultured spirochete TaxID=156406 RepID=A0A3P3XUT6_9SPIR|nr:putative ABC-type transporter, integral membrane subunit [uncultured spirochete]
MNGENMTRRTSLFLYGALCVILIFSMAPLVAFLKIALSSLWDANKSLGAAGTISSFLSRIPVSTIVRSLKFTLSQSLASTLLAIAIGLPGAWFAARFRFAGRKALLALAAVPFCFPPILVILAFILYYGKEGFLSSVISWFFGPRKQYQGFLYSFWGLVMVHAFYNFPIAVHQISALWIRIPDTQMEAAKTLGAGKLKAFRTGVLPWLLPGIAQAAGLIFLYCFFSFTTVLVFGGRTGTTIEVEIYQALRYQSNYPLALTFSVIETFFALLGILMLTHIQGRTRRSLRDFGRTRELTAPKGIQRFFIIIYGIFILIFFIGPLMSIAIEAFKVPSSMGGTTKFGFGNFERLIKGFQAPLLGAILSTIKLSGSAALIATIAGIIASLALFFAEKSNKNRAVPRTIEVLQWLPMAVSSAIFAYGWLFLSTNRVASTALVAAQAVIAWPFVSRAVHASLRAIDPRIREAAKTLGASPFRAFMTVELRTILPSIAAAAAFAFSITAGDVNVPLMLGMGEVETLPLLLYRLTAAYRFNEACAAGLVLGLMTGIVFLLKEKVIDVA